MCIRHGEAGEVTGGPGRAAPRSTLRLALPTDQPALKPLRTICAFLLAIPLIGSGLNAAFPFVEPPTGTGFRGEEILQSLRDGGLFRWLALAHLVVGVCLLIPRTRFAAALLQLPASIGILAFNAVLFPPGLAPAVAILGLNLIALWQPRRLAQLFVEPDSETDRAASPASAR